MKSIGLPGHVRFGREVLGELEAAERREWWLANGRGAYASGTIAGTLTRRYHGLLIAPIAPPLGRSLVVAKADATLEMDGQSWPLHTNRWAGGVISPTGHLLLESFRLDGRIPVWRYVIGDLGIEHRIWMEPGQDTTYAAWRLDRALGDRRESLRLRVRLLVNARDHHGTMAAHGFVPELAPCGTELKVTVAGSFELSLQCQGGAIEPDSTWIERFDLPIERERGLPDHDNHLCAGEAILELHPGQWAGITASVNAIASPHLEEALRRALAYETDLLQRATSIAPELIAAPPWVHQLVLAADSFIFERHGSATRRLVDRNDESVIAGYPWFGDWGRDTMIALPGLTLATGRHASARRILQNFARHVDQGMLPNWFPGAGDLPEYNTADAALWFIEAWRAYVATTGDWVALHESFEVLEAIATAYRVGTRFGIGVDESDGLLRAGVPGAQVTWMDAKINDWVVSPRIGKPVELNALWYNALCAMAWFSEGLCRSSTTYRSRAERVRRAFARFWNDQSACLFDVLDGPAGDDPTLRPNQILAVSLAGCALTPERQRAVVAACGRELLTSFGLRSLAPRHDAYRAEYRGAPAERDAMYHQGPVWGWLLGHYALAEFRVSGDARQAQRRLEPIADHLLDAGLGTVSEIFDGAPPHHPRGAPSQAWSVACTLEAWWRLERARIRGCATIGAPLAVA